MSRKNKNIKNNFFTKHKRFTLTLILFLVVLPIIFFSAIYFWQGAVLKHTLFEDKTHKVVKDQKFYTITADLKEIRDPIDEDSPFKYKFNYEVEKNNNVVNELINLKIEFQLAPKYHPYVSKAVSRGSTLKGSFEVDFDFDMEKARFPFLAPKGPILYLKISFTEIIFNTNNPGDNITQEHEYILKINYTTEDLIYI